MPEECHVLNFVTKIKPAGEKKVYKSNTHVSLNDEVEFSYAVKKTKMHTTLKSS